jgi:hypothetical protein
MPKEGMVIRLDRDLEIRPEHDDLRYVYRPFHLEDRLWKQAIAGFTDEQADLQHGTYFLHKGCYYVSVVLAWRCDAAKSNFFTLHLLHGSEKIRSALTARDGCFYHSQIQTWVQVEEDGLLSCRVEGAEGSPIKFLCDYCEIAVQKIR